MPPAPAPRWRRRRWRWRWPRPIISAASRPPADGAVSAEELAHARDNVRAAQAALAAAQGGHDQTLSQIHGTDIANNPDVLAAEATLRTAMIAQGHMRIVAPVDGVVAQRTVQVGQQVAAGTPLMAVVPLTNVWVDANFKEVQLQDMRVGQPVTVTADIYGGKVTYHGQVEGLGAGSGSAFALAAAAECQRQLDQDRAARAGAHRARSPGAGGSSAARGAFGHRQRVDQGHLRPAGDLAGRAGQHPRRSGRRRQRQGRRHHRADPGGEWRDADLPRTAGK